MHNWIDNDKTLKLLEYSANIYMLRVSKENTRKKCKVCSKLTIKTPEMLAGQLDFFSKRNSSMIIKRNNEPNFFDINECFL